MAKKSKKIEPTTQSDRVKVDDEILSKLSKEKVMKIPDSEVVLLPISGAFKNILMILCIISWMIWKQVKLSLHFK